jgi:tetratricopeptide (TPR) repeat protein
MHKKTQKLTGLTCSCNMLQWLICLLFAFQPVFANSQSAYQSGSEKFEQKQYDSALFYFNQMVAGGPAAKEAYYNRGLVYYELQKYDQAIHDFSAAIAVDTNFKEAEWMLAVSLQKKGDWKQAFTTYQMLETKYSGYNGLKKRIFYYRLAVYICYNWYYMVAIMFVVIIFVTVVIKAITYKKG